MVNNSKIYEWWQLNRRAFGYGFMPYHTNRCKSEIQTQAITYMFCYKIVLIHITTECMGDLAIASVFAVA